MTAPTPVPRIKAIEITRQGENGDWRIAIPAVPVTTLPSGKQFEEHLRVDPQNAAELLHDEEFAACMALVEKVANRLVAGDLKPLPPVVEPTKDTP